MNTPLKTISFFLPLYTHFIPNVKGKLAYNAASEAVSHKVAYYSLIR